MRLQNARFVKPSTKRRQGWSGRSGAERRRAAELCRRTALRLLERSEPPTHKTPAAAFVGSGIRPSAAETGGRANVTKQAFCYASRNRRRIKSKKPQVAAVLGGTTTTPPIRSVFRDFKRAKKAAYRAAKLDIKTRIRVFFLKSLIRDFREILKDDILIE